MDFLEIKNWNHVFHDAGGLWTWELLRLSPERITNLIILNSVIYEEGFKPPIRFKKGFLAKFIMKMYSSHNINEFVICLGYKGYIIKEFFHNYFLHTSDVTIDIQKNNLNFQN